MDSNTSPNTAKSILWSIIHFLSFHFLYLVYTLVASGIAIAWSYIPVLNFFFEILVDFLNKRGDGLGSALSWLVLVISYLSTRSLFERIIKHQPTRQRSFLLSGCYIVALNVIRLVLEILFNDGSGALIAIGFIFAGILIIRDFTNKST